MSRCLLSAPAMWFEWYCCKICTWFCFVFLLGYQVWLVCITHWLEQPWGLDCLLTYNAQSNDNFFFIILSVDEAVALWTVLKCFIIWLVCQRNVNKVSNYFSLSWLMKKQYLSRCLMSALAMWFGWYHCKILTWFCHVFSLGYPGLMICITHCVEQPWQQDCLLTNRAQCEDNFFFVILVVDEAVAWLVHYQDWFSYQISCPLKQPSELVSKKSFMAELKQLWRMSSRSSL